MEIILLENILNLGNIGDKVKVKDGYGRNYLLKQGKALRYNKENRDLVDKQKDQLNKKNNETKSNSKISKEDAKNKLLELKEYLDLGIITQDEFDEKAKPLKKILLGN